MTNVYNLLREACGVSQAEAAEFVHGTRLDSVKSWCSDRRTAPPGVISDLQRLGRQIRKAGTEYAECLKRRSEGDVYIIGLPSDEQDARTCGFPSVSAQMRAIAVAISLLPDNSEIRMVERVRGAIPAPVMEREEVMPVEADCRVLLSMQFSDGKFYTSGNINRRKYERLEEIGWVKGIGTNVSDVEYHLTTYGRAQLTLSKAAEAVKRDVPDPAPRGRQTTVNSQPRRGPASRLLAHQEYLLDDLSFRVEQIDGNLVTVRTSSGETMKLYASEVLL
jgi:hypothetical protein